MKSRHPENTLDLPIRMDRIDMASEAGNLAISSHNNSDPRRIHNRVSSKSNTTFSTFSLTRSPVRPFTDIGGSVVIHLLRHTHHQAIINDLKVLKIFHISSHFCCCTAFLILLLKKENMPLVCKFIFRVLCNCLMVCFKFRYCAVFSASWERYLCALLAVSVSGNSSMILS